MIQNFLTRYFGSNFEIHKFVGACLRNNRRDIALGVNKAIKIAQKGNWAEHADAFDDLETLVATVGKDK